MAERPPAAVVYSATHLRQLLSQARPGEHLVFQIAPTVPLEEAKLLWEAVSLQRGHAELVQPEVLRCKHLAIDFVDMKIKELESWKDHCSGLIGGMNNWVQLRRNSLRNGPDLPPYHRASVMMGPELYLDLDKIGRIENVDEHRQAILDEFLLKRVLVRAEDNIDAEAEGGGGDPVAAARREMERESIRSLINFNITFLQIKIGSLMALRDEISKGIKSLKEVKEGRSSLGCGNADYSSFWDIPAIPMD